MVYAITRHPRLETDLEDIHRLISDYAGLDVADRKIIEIVHFIDRLKDFPKIGTVRESVLAGLRAIPASDKAIVCFTVDDATQSVFVLGVSYAGSDWQKHMVTRSKS
jgi:plasmid stabilization system protein ParE